MSKKITAKMALISRFLDTDSVDISKLKVKDVLKLPISSLKHLEGIDIDVIEEIFKLTKISDFTKIDQNNPFKKFSRNKQIKAKINKILKIEPEFEDRLKKCINISLIIRRIKKQSVKLKYVSQKIIVIGLDNAGKTAIIKKFGGRLGIQDLASLQPTKGVARQEIKSADLNLLLWDFGGQENYRSDYLSSPEKYFLGVNLIIYVLDIQDFARYNESIEYFEKVLDNIIALQENPFILIFLHKYDPDIRDDDDVALNVEYLMDLTKGVFKERDLNYEIFLSSLYSTISNEPIFSKFLKSTMAETAFLFDPSKTKVEDLGQIVENSLNAVIQLSNVVEKLTKRIEVLEKPRKGRPPKPKTPDGLPAPEYAHGIPLPPPPPPPGAKPARGTQSVRSAIISELREMFTARKRINRD